MHHVHIQQSLCTSDYLPFFLLGEAWLLATCLQLTQDSNVKQRACRALLVAKLKRDKTKVRNCTRLYARHARISLMLSLTHALTHTRSHSHTRTRSHSHTL